MERHLRHPARPHADPRQARRGPGSAGAAASARRAAADRARLGDPPLPAPDGSGTLVVALDLRQHAAVVEHSDGRAQRIPLTPDRAVADVTRDVLAAAGDPKIDMTPQEVSWTVPLDEDREHTTYDAAAVADYFIAATRAAQVLTEYRAPYRGRLTPVNAWWGSFDLAVSLFSGRSAKPPSNDFIMRNSMDAQEVAVGWWPGDARYPHAAFYAYAYPAPDGFAAATLEPAAARWNSSLGEYLLDWDDARVGDDPHAAMAARSATGTPRWQPAARDSLRRSRRCGFVSLRPVGRGTDKARDLRFRRTPTITPTSPDLRRRKPTTVRGLSGP
jgi:hypothetical protein